MAKSSVEWLSGAIQAALMLDMRRGYESPPQRRFTARERGMTYLHPTKGWRGDLTRPRGTNKRRYRFAA